MGEIRILEGAHPDGPWCAGGAKNVVPEFVDKMGVGPILTPEGGTVTTYRGTPAYGPLTGAEVELLGVSQFLVQDGRIVKEVRVYDEIALRAQIDAGRSDEFTDTNIY